MSGPPAGAVAGDTPFARFATLADMLLFDMLRLREELERAGLLDEEDA